MARTRSLSRARTQKMGAYGTNKGTNWIHSGKLPTRADRVTGSMDRYDIEYGIPDDVEMYSEIDIKKLKQSVEMEL